MMFNDRLLRMSEKLKRRAIKPVVEKVKTNPRANAAWGIAKKRSRLYSINFQRFVSQKNCKIL